MISLRLGANSFFVKAGPFLYRDRYFRPALIHVPPDQGPVQSIISSTKLLIKDYLYISYRTDKIKCANVSVPFFFFFFLTKM